MKKQKLELRVLEIVDRVKRGQRVEDAHVELKSELPAADKAARQLGALANSAHGEPILWIIGVDEHNKAVTGAADVELSEWIPQLNSRFDELPPYLVMDLNVPVDGLSVIALLFETDRAPYVVNCKGQGAVEKEVPWREGTRTRSAKRSELLKLLIASCKEPAIEVESATLIFDSKNNPASGDFLVRFFVVPSNSDRVVFPAHRTKIGLSIPKVSLERPFWDVHFRKETTPNAECDCHAAVVQGPGFILLSGKFRGFADEQEFYYPVNIKVELGVVGIDNPIVIQFVVQTEPTELNSMDQFEERYVWRLSWREELLKDGNGMD